MKKSDDKRHGRDEMNFAEFPITLLSERAPRGVTTLEFELQEWDPRLKQSVERKLTVEGSPKYGLPTAKDDEVLLGLIQLTKSVTGFTSSTVGFTQRAFLELIEWSDEGRSYGRLRKAFHRLQGVTLYYENAWKDNADKRYVTQGGFGVLSRFELRDGRQGKKRIRDEEPDSVFEWNSVIHKSFQAGHLKKLDYELVKSFRYAATKRLYRHLDKHFYPENGRTQLTYDLKALAYQHIGVTRRKDSSAIKDAIEPAILELEEAGFITAVSKDERFRKVGSGTWNVAFALAPPHRGKKGAAKRSNDGSIQNAKGNDGEAGRDRATPRLLDQLQAMAEEKRDKLVESALAHCDRSHPEIANGYRRKRQNDGESSRSYLELVLRTYLSARSKKNAGEVSSDN